MRIYLVDNTIDGKGASPRELRSVLERLCEGVEILTEPFPAVSLSRVESLRPSHIILSGQSHPWDSYAPQSLSGVFAVIRIAPQPILGVCGGHQQIALAHGARVGLMQRLAPGEGYAGAKRERGYLPVKINGEGLFNRLPPEISVWHSHCDEVEELPRGFRCTAWNQACSIQAMQHSERPVFGVQFHPELFDDQHPHGERVMRNFLEL